MPSGKQGMSTTGKLLMECLISTYQRILNDEGGNEFKTPHNGVHRKQAMGVYVCDMPIDIAQIDRLELLIDAYFHVNP